MGIERIAVTDKDIAEWRHTGKTYPIHLARALNPRPNISIKRSAREIRMEICAWIIAAACLSLLAYGTYVAAMDYLGK